MLVKLPVRGFSLLVVREFPDLKNILKVTFPWVVKKLVVKGRSRKDTKALWLPVMELLTPLVAEAGIPKMVRPVVIKLCKRRCFAFFSLA